MDINIKISRELAKFIPNLKAQMKEYITKHMYPQYVSLFGPTEPRIFFDSAIDFQIIPTTDFEYGNFWLNFHPILHKENLYLDVEFHYNVDEGNFRGKVGSNKNTYEKEFKDATIKLEKDMKKILLKKVFIK